MNIDLSAYQPIDCGEAVDGLQPAIIDVTPPGSRPGSIYCPVLVDKAANRMDIPVQFRMSFPQAFESAIAWGERLKSKKSN